MAWIVVGGGVISLNVIENGQKVLKALNASSEPQELVVDAQFQRARKLGRIKQVKVERKLQSIAVDPVVTPPVDVSSEKPVESDSGSVKVDSEEPAAPATSSSTPKKTRKKRVTADVVEDSADAAAVENAPAVEQAKEEEPAQTELVPDQNDQIPDLDTSLL
jgi:hypothetical protein